MSAIVILSGAVGAEQAACGQGVCASPTQACPHYGLPAVTTAPLYGTSVSYPSSAVYGTAAGYPTAPVYVLQPVYTLPVAPMSGAQSVVMPAGWSSVNPYAAYQASRDASMDRLVAAMETFDEMRRFFSSTSRLQILKADPLLQQFARERIVGAELTASSGLTPEYRAWLFTTILESGDRLDASVAIPNFKLLPSIMAQSWDRIWARSFAPVYANQAAYAGAAGSAVVAPSGGRRTALVRRTASARAREVGAFSAGAVIALIEKSGEWYKVKLESGKIGFISAADLNLMPAASTIPWRGAETVTLWQNQAAPQTAAAPAWANVAEAQSAYAEWLNQAARYHGGYYSNYGWAYPHQTQLTTERR